MKIRPVGAVPCLQRDRQTWRS